MKKKATLKPKKPAMAGSKKAKLIRILEGDGATLDAISKKFSWQRHTTRGLISVLGRTLKIESTRTDKGERFYRIAKC